MLFGAVCSLFHGHSPGGATVLLCLIVYVIHRPAVGDENVMGLVGGVRGREKRIFVYACVKLVRIRQLRNQDESKLTNTTFIQMRNHVFKVGGSNFLL